MIGAAKEVQTPYGIALVQEVPSSTPGHKRYEVFSGAMKLGEVWSYTGRLTIPIKGSRLIKNGKIRKLWAYDRTPANRGPFRNRTSYGNESRIRCITNLMPGPR